MITKILILVLAITLMIIPSMAANDSMNIQDIENTKAIIPFGASFFTMIISGVKWFAFFGFIVGIVSIIAHGAIANALNNANMSANAQTALFTIGKLMVLAVAIFLLGSYIFKTYL